MNARLERPSLPCFDMATSEKLAPYSPIVT
jgi:hypothetical protein